MGRCGWFVVLMAMFAGPGAASAFEPAPGAVTTLRPTFVWEDGDQFASYRLLFRKTGAAVADPTVTLNADDPTICPGNGECRFGSASAGYPAWDAADYTWAIRATTRTGTTVWWGPNFAPFHLTPGLPDALSVNWTGDEITATWPQAAGVSEYRVTFEHGLFAPATAEVSCSTATCTLTQNVSYIPYGTVHIRLRSCRSDGYCSPEPRSTDALRGCPQIPAAPVIIAPSTGATVSSLVALQFSHVGYGESYRVRITDTTSGNPVVEEKVEYPQLACTPGSCTRLYPLPAGHYRAGVSASCAAAVGPETNVDFATDGGRTAPQLLAPTAGSTTSVYPLVAWNKIFGIDRYEVIFNESSGGAVTKAVTVCPEPEICVFDPQQAGLPPIEGNFTATVRIAMATMPPAAPVAFHASFAYVPPAATELSPIPGSRLRDVPTVGVSFRLDPQVPLVSVELADTGGATLATSGRVQRLSSCKPQLAETLSLLCSFPFSLSQFGTHLVAARASTPSDTTGGVTTQTANSDFDRSVPVFGNVDKATYSIYAQNTQFLPSSPFNGDGSNAYFQSDTSRADLLADYILKNKFDVIALSEVFTMDAKRQLNFRLGSPYSGVSRIDTAGRADEMSYASIVGGYFGGWWLNAQVPGGLFGASKVIADWADDANSGLAIYTLFRFKEHPTENWEENSRCTDKTFNDLNDDHADYESGFKISDRVWFRQYCHGAGNDDLSAKGIAIAELENPVTGIPLVIAWSHTQAYTTDKTFFELSTGDYSESYEDRATQVEDNAGPAVRYVVDRMGTAPFDAFILGDWNIPSPAAAADLPRKHPNLAAQDDGWANPVRMYTAPPGADDPNNPKLSALVGDDAPNDDARLFGQYWDYFDPRNPGRTFTGFHDLWLENPAGDPGFTFDPNSNKIAKCHESGEPCHGTGALDKGARYDQVLARFHATNMPLAGAGNGQYPGTGVRAWGDRTSCVQHVRLARDFGYSDHWGTIIEVGPSAPFCNTNTAKADPHLWRFPVSAPIPTDKTKDAAAGRHKGRLAYGGANEWFHFSEAGGFDVIVVNKDATIPALRVDAYDARDISTMIPVADAEQKTDQTVSQTCPEAVESIGVDGYIPVECATAEKRITYRSPGPFFMRIRAAYTDGSLCDTCAGEYQVIFRKRTCKVYWDAVPVGRGIPNASDRGWFGQGQPRCWFSYELAKSTQEDDPQTLQIADVFADNQALCQAAGGPCSNHYEVQFFDAAPATDFTKFPAEPTVEIHSREGFAPGMGGRSVVTDSQWFKRVDPMNEGVMPETGRRKLYAVVERGDSQAAHEAAFAWTTNLMSVTYHALSVFDIEDDIEIEIEICLPFIGCIIDEPKDPFETEDEISTLLWTNSRARESLRIHDFGVDYAGGKGARFPNEAPGGLPSGCKAYQRCRQPDVADTLVGTTVNYTRHSYARVLELDSPTSNDEVVGDTVMCGVSGAAPYFTWQATRYKEQWQAILAGALEAPTAFEFSDDCPDDDPQLRYRLQVTVPRIQ